VNDIQIHEGETPTIELAVQLETEEEAPGETEAPTAPDQTNLDAVETHKETNDTEV